MQAIRYRKIRDAQVLLICPELTFHLTRAPHLKARLVRETTPERRRDGRHGRHGRHGRLSALVPRPPNLVACDLSGGFEFVSAMGLWDLYLQIAGSLGPRRRRGRRRCPRKGRKGVTIGVEA